MIAGGLVLIVLGAAAAVLLLTRNTLPGCAEQPTRNSLATIFRENNVSMTGYDETREVGRGENEISCTAVVSLADGGKLDLTYRVVREPDRTIVRASWQRREP